jgi:hypothetical protein
MSVVYDVGNKCEALDVCVEVLASDVGVSPECGHYSDFGLLLSRAFIMAASSASASSWDCFWIACMSSYNWPIC